MLLRHFEEEMQTTPKKHALIVIQYVRTKLQLRLAWGTTRLTMREYDSEGRKSSKDEKVLLITHLRNLMICKRASVACANRKDALCFVQLSVMQMSVPALITCAKTQREGNVLAKTSAVRPSPEYEKTCGTRTHKEDQQNPKSLE